MTELTESPARDHAAPHHPHHWLSPDDANAITHGVALVLSVIGLAFLIGWSSGLNDPWRLASCAIFGVSMVIVYAASTLLHTRRGLESVERFEVIDHCAIYVLIAGTYTPLFATPMRGVFGWSVLAVVWSLALAGIIFKLRFGSRRYVAISLLSYLVTGWVPVFMLKQMFAALPAAAVWWLIAGGLAYTAGIPFYLSKRFTYAHAAWHLFVMAGSACHYVAVVYAVFGKAALPSAG